MTSDDGSTLNPFQHDPETTWSVVTTVCARCGQPVSGDATSCMWCDVRELQDFVRDKYRAPVPDIPAAIVAERAKWYHRKAMEYVDEMVRSARERTGTEPRVIFYQPGLGYGTTALYDEAQRIYREKRERAERLREATENPEPLMPHLRVAYLSDHWEALNPMVSREVSELVSLGVAGAFWPVIT